jgi:hypothetical protein
MKTLATFALLAGFISIPANAQKLDLNLNFDALAKNATEKTELNLQGPLLELFRQKVAEKLPADKEHQTLFASIDQVSVHSYEYAKPGDYADSDLDPLRKQMAGAAGWSRFLDVKEKGESTQIYVLMQGDKPAGFLLISAEPKELTVIHVAGSIQLAQLNELVDSTIKFKELAQQ